MPVHEFRDSNKQLNVGWVGPEGQSLTRPVVCPLTKDRRGGTLVRVIIQMFEQTDIRPGRQLHDKN
jgi:hypothetical protein